LVILMMDGYLVGKLQVHDKVRPLKNA
jgi:hypothetical protein